MASWDKTPDLEAVSFRRMKRRVVAQRWAFGLAWLFTALTFTTEIKRDNVHIISARLALVDAPLLLGLVATLAVICWIIYGDLRRRG